MADRYFIGFRDRCVAKTKQLKTRWSELSDHGQVGVCLAGVTGVLAFWAVFWPVPTEVKGHGVLIYPDNAGVLNARAAGQVLSINVRVGDQVRQGLSLIHI